MRQVRKFQKHSQRSSAADYQRLIFGAFAWRTLSDFCQYVKYLSRYHIPVKIWVPSLLITITLACATNTPVAQVSEARATRTAIPTFTDTPIPATATETPTLTPTPLPTDTPLFTNTPLPTDTPLFTDTPSPTDTPTETPVPPTNTALPPTTTPIPTDTPVPTATPVPAPVAVSPLAPPTLTPIPASRPGTYSPKNKSTDGNCAHVGVTGIVRDGDDDNDPPMPDVTIIVTGDDDDHRGPYFATTAFDGKYSLVIGETSGFGQTEFKAEIWGPEVKTDDTPFWETTNHCDEDNSIQIMILDWAKRR